MKSYKLQSIWQKTADWIKEKKDVFIKKIAWTMYCFMLLIFVIVVLKSLMG